jgi:hypothetical protein
LQKAARHYELAIEVIMPLFVSDAENANLSGIFKGARRGIQVYESLDISNMSLKAMELSFRRQVLYNDKSLTSSPPFLQFLEGDLCSRKHDLHATRDNRNHYRSSCFGCTSTRTRK